MTFIMSINLIMSIIFIFMNHPLSAGLILLFQTILISTAMVNFSYSAWFSYMLFLIFIGGMMILFMYMTSIASNEKFKFNMKLMFTFMVSAPILLIPCYLSDISLNNKEINNLTFNSSMMESASKFINFPANIIMTFLILNLFIALIATVKISSNMKGPLRQMN